MPQEHPLLHHTHFSLPVIKSLVVHKATVTIETSKLNTESFMKFETLVQNVFCFATENLPNCELQLPNPRAETVERGNYPGHT
jgi:hypothetical protein